MPGKDGHYIPPEFYGLSEEEAQGLYDDGIEYQRWQQFTPDFVGVKSQDVDVEDLNSHMAESTRLYEEGRLSQSEAVVSFRNDLPVTIFFVGDVHYGSIYTAHDVFMEHIRGIVDAPNCYVIFMSNLIDNAMPARFPDGMLSNGLPPDKQVYAIRRIVEDLDRHGKVPVTSNCHEGWTHRATGQDVNALLFGFEGRKFPVLENGGRLRLQFPSRQYISALYHKVGPFESNFNETHALRQMNRLRQNMEADIVVGAHKHFSAANVVYEGFGERSKQVAYIRSGTYKGITETHDMFAVNRYGATGEIGGQSVTILPEIDILDAHLQYEIGILAQQVCLQHALGR